jgi:hypothetical protein
MARLLVDSPLRLTRKYRHASRLEGAGARLVLAAREDVDLVGHHHVGKADQLQDLPPLCFQQSTGNSTGPELDIFLG